MIGFGYDADEGNYNFFFKNKKAFDKVLVIIYSILYTDEIDDSGGQLKQRQNIVQNPTSRRNMFPHMETSCKKTGVVDFIGMKKFSFKICK